MADLHIHSKYSRATSREMSPENIWKWAQLKGISVIGTGDFTHPGWLHELRDKLEPAGNGLFILKKDLRTGYVPASCRSEVFFMLTVEISCIYSKNSKTRKVHSIVLVPDLPDAERLNTALSKIGNLGSDGRPILGMDAKRLLEIVMEKSPEAMYVPAHAWTPHFSVFGAVSGFDSLEECFGELAPCVHAIETGLSSDPPMNRRLSALDNITLVSNSDAHSPAKIGREANMLDTDISYNAIKDAVETGEGFTGTIEFFPEEGKYHYDGHRNCGVNIPPDVTIKHNYICPVCGKRLTVGVMHRVELLADRINGVQAEDKPGFRSIIPLPEVISEVIRVGVNSKAVNKVYMDLLEKFGNEFHVLMESTPDEIRKAGFPEIAGAIARMRAGEISITPGFDGEFGKIKILGG